MPNELAVKPVGDSAQHFLRDIFCDGVVFLDFSGETTLHPMVMILKHHGRCLRVPYGYQPEIFRQYLRVLIPVHGKPWNCYTFYVRFRTIPDYLPERWTNHIPQLLKKTHRDIRKADGVFCFGHRNHYQFSEQRSLRHIRLNQVKHIFLSFGRFIFPATVFGLHSGAGLAHHN